MCSKNWCGFCNDKTEKQDYPVKESVTAHVCKCCDLTTSVTEKNITYNIVIKEKEEVDV